MHASAEIIGRREMGLNAGEISCCLGGSRRHSSRESQLSDTLRDGRDACKPTRQCGFIMSYITLCTIELRDPPMFEKSTKYDTATSCNPISGERALELGHCRLCKQAQKDRARWEATRDIGVYAGAFYRDTRIENGDYYLGCRV